MTDPIYKDLSKFISKEDKIFGNVEKYIISYTQPNSNDPSKVWKHNAVANDLTDEAVMKIESLKEGDLYCTHRTKAADGFPVITNISDAKDAEKADNKAGFFKGGNKTFVPKDDTGITVGAGYKDALEMLSLAHKLDKPVEEVFKEVSKLTDTIITDKLAKEAKIRASKATTVATKTVEAKPLSRAEQLKAKELLAKADTESDLIDDSDLDDVTFEE